MKKKLEWSNMWKAHCLTFPIWFFFVAVQMVETKKYSVAFGEDIISVTGAF